MSELLFRKEVDWSLLNTGITIPLENQELLLGNLGEKLNRGDTRDVKIILKMFHIQQESIILILVKNIIVKKMFSKFYIQKKVIWLLN